MVTAEQVAEWRRLAEASASASVISDETRHVSFLADAEEEFLSAAETAVPALCDEVERLTAQVAQLTQERDEAREKLERAERETRAAQNLLRAYF